MTSAFQSTRAYHLSQVVNSFFEENAVVQEHCRSCSLLLQLYFASMFDIFFCSYSMDYDVIQLHQGELPFDW